MAFVPCLIKANSSDQMDFEALVFIYDFPGTTYAAAPD